jgi:hypothetical protein
LLGLKGDGMIMNLGLLESIKYIKIVREYDLEKNMVCIQNETEKCSHNHSVGCQKYINKDDQRSDDNARIKGKKRA